MMSNRQALRYAVIGMMLLSIVLISIPFVSSMRPSARADAVGSPVDISGQESGTVQEYVTSWGRAFVVRQSDSELHVFHIWTNGSTYMLPDEKWYRAFIPCEDFGVDPAQGLATEASVFRCRSSSWGDYWEAEFVWTLDGRSLGKNTEDMPATPFERYGDKLILNPWKIYEAIN